MSANMWISAFKKYAVFDGRGSRMEYFCFFIIFLLMFAIILGIDFILHRFTDIPNPHVITGVLHLILMLGLVIPKFAVEVRRLHDLNLSGWWALGFSALDWGTTIVFKDSYTEWRQVFFCAALILLGILPGSKGPNKYDEYAL